MFLLGLEKETDETCVCVRLRTHYVCVNVYKYFIHIYLEVNSFELFQSTGYPEGGVLSLQFKPGHLHISPNMLSTCDEFSHFL